MTPSGTPWAPRRHPVDTPCTARGTAYCPWCTRRYMPAVWCTQGGRGSGCPGRREEGGRSTPAIYHTGVTGPTSTGGGSPSLPSPGYTTPPPRRP